MTSAWDFWRIQRALKSLSPWRHISPHSDPTMLFSGVIFGYEAFVRQGFYKALWPFKQALFYHADRLVEATIRQYGVAFFKKSFVQAYSFQDFYLFDVTLCQKLCLVEDGMRMRQLYGEVREECFRLPNLDRSQQEKIYQCFIESSHLGLISTFHQSEWENLDLLSPGDSSEALSICDAEERAKNVAVVMAFLEARQVYQSLPSFPHSAEDIVSACSHWFTLLDDPLDLKIDYEYGNPNYLLAWAAAEGESGAVIEHLPEAAVNAEGQLLDSLTYLRRYAPKTHQRYREEYQAAKNLFCQRFPVLPKLLARSIEKRAMGKLESPF